VLIAGPVSALQVDCETAVRCIVAIDRARDTRDALNPILVEVYTDAIMLATHDCPAVTKWVARGRKLCDTAKAAAHKVLEVCPRTTGLTSKGMLTIMRAQHHSTERNHTSAVRGARPRKEL
jgi:hypothetical protein